MAKIVVARGLVAEKGDPKNDARAKFAKALGREIISRGHVVLGGCRTELDAVVANARRRRALKRTATRRSSSARGLPKSPLHMTRVRSLDRGLTTGVLCPAD